MPSLLALTRSNGQPNIHQLTGTPDKRAIAGLDTLLLVLPDRVPATLWRKLPQGGFLQSLARRKPTDKDKIISTHLANKRQTSVHIARFKPGQEAFESLTFARRLLATGSTSNPCRIR
jgi:hypothetical protein